MNKRWAVGFHNRGHGHGDFAVIVEESREVVAEIPAIPDKDITEHIVKLHNDYLESR